MERQIAVICASAPGANTGMESVDLALLELAEKYGFRDQIKFYRLYPAPITPGIVNSSRISYSTIPSGAEFFQSQQAIIYWGDFLHMRQYQEAVARKLVAAGLSDNLAEAGTRVRQVFLQTGQQVEVLERTLAFGGTLLFNTIQDELQEPYRAALERFLKLSKGVWFRDVYSALKACHIRGTFQPDCLGVDCAALLDPDHLRQSRGGPAGRDLAGVFLGRTAGNVAPMLDFSADLARLLGLRPSWLRWGDALAFPALTAISGQDAVRALNDYSESPGPQTEFFLNSLLDYKIIITDTYHLCVNAWNLGVPAICFVASEFSQIRNVSFGDSLARRDKREVFMSMYDALGFLVPAAELADASHRQARLLRIAELLNSGRAVAAIHGRIRLHAQFAEKELMHALSGLL